MFLITLPVRVSASSVERDAEKESKRRVFGFDVIGGIEQSFWQVNDKAQCQTCQEDIVDYETEGLSLYRVNGDVKLWNVPLIDFYYEQPFKRTEKQREILRVNKSQTTGSEKYAIGVALDPIAKRYFSDRRFLTAILKRASSIRFKHTTELFWGNARANLTSTYLPLGTSIDYQNSIIVDGISFSAGDQVAFRTAFSDQEISAAVWDFDLSFLRIAKNTARAGYYRSKWERISDVRLNKLSGASGNAILYEAKFRSQGVLVSFESTETGAPGLNFDVIMKWGLNNSLDSAIDWERLFGENTRVQTNMIKFGAWYNFYLNKETRKGLFMSAGGTMDLRDTKVHVNPGAFEDPFPETANSDTIFKLFATTGYRF